jgi:hypothetical protein
MGERKNLLKFFLILNPLGKFFTFFPFIIIFINLLLIIIFLFFSFLLFSERVLEQSYHGLIKENETYVEITPLIKVDETKVCGFQIIKKNKEIPFQVSPFFLILEL